MKPFIKQGRAIPEEVRNRIIFLCNEGQRPSQIELELNLKQQTVSNIINNFIDRGSVQALTGGNRQRPARTDDVCTYIEYCKQKQPSIYASEIQNLLLENHVCLPQNDPSQSSISRCLKSDLGYSYKRVQKHFAK